jgi:2,5-dioxopentanoate dehydrogenase
MPAALEARADALAQAFAQSLTMGAGQFCTNPGLVLAIDGPALEKFLAAAADALGAGAPQTMLTANIQKAYDDGVSAFAADPSVRTLARGPESGGACQGRAALFAVDAESFLADKRLQHEVFGASSLVVRCRDVAEMGEVIASLEGQLTATVHFDKADEALVASLMPALERKAGRILGNGWPTGVEVSHAMVHGGPYPATTDGRTTSVGSLAIARFLRPICYQNLPGALLPEALRDDNPFGLARRIDGAVVQAE